MNIIKSAYKHTPVYVLIAIILFAGIVGISKWKDHKNSNIEVSYSGIQTENPGECIDVEGYMPKKYDTVDEYMAAEPEASEETLNIMNSVGCNYGSGMP